MSDPETILLPRSGVRASIRLDEGYGMWFVRLPMYGLPPFFHRDRDEAIRRADVLAQTLFPELLPADARERIAQAVVDSLRLVQTQPPCECPDDDARPYADQCGPCRQGPQFVADKILRALRGEVKS